MKTKESSGPPSPAQSAETRIEGTPPPRRPSDIGPTAGPRIEHEGVIARGGMGTVHRVFDRAIRRFAAMKVLDETLAMQPHARRRFLAEAQIAGQLDHPNIVPVYDLDVTEDGTPRDFTMKLVDGVTFTSKLTPERVAARSASELFELLQAFVKVCDAVAFAHGRGVIHRDLKPDNVMLGDYGQVYVMDWGIAKVLSAGGRAAVTLDEDDLPDESGSIIGSAQYMAPEQAWGDNDAIDARTDVFALGGLLYQILTGLPPYRAAFPQETLHMARLGLVKPPEEANPDVPISPSLSRIAMKALSGNPDHRYANVDAMKREVAHLPRGQRDPARRRRARRRVHPHRGARRGVRDRRRRAPRLARDGAGRGLRRDGAARRSPAHRQRGRGRRRDGDRRDGRGARPRAPLRVVARGARSHARRAPVRSRRARTQSRRMMV